MLTLFIYLHCSQSWGKHKPLWHGSIIGRNIHPNINYSCMQTTEIYTQFPTSHVYSWISQFSVLQYSLCQAHFSFLSAIVEVNIPPQRSPFVHGLSLSKKRSYTKGRNVHTSISLCPSFWQGSSHHFFLYYPKLPPSTFIHASLHLPPILVHRGGRSEVFNISTPAVCHQSIIEEHVT